MHKTYIKAYAQDISLTTLLENGFELSDDGQTEAQVIGELQKEHLLNNLTKRQQKVVYCLNDKGLTRKQTASELNICLQAVHQIVLRIRKRLKKKTNVVWH